MIKFEPLLILKALFYIYILIFYCKYFICLCYRDDYFFYSAEQGSSAKYRFKDF